MQQSLPGPAERRAIKDGVPLDRIGSRPVQNAESLLLGFMYEGHDPAKGQAPGGVQRSIVTGASYLDPFGKWFGPQINQLAHRARTAQAARTPLQPRKGGLRSPTNKSAPAMNMLLTPAPPSN